MLPIERKSVEPLAAHSDALHVSAKHQSLHHLVAQSEWSDKAVLKCVRNWVMPKLGAKSRFYWIVDDSGFPKKRSPFVGVARQYCGQLGKQEQLSGGGESVVDHRAWQCADRLAAVLAGENGLRIGGGEKRPVCQRS